MAESRDNFIENLEIENVDYDIITLVYRSSRLFSHNHKEIHMKLKTRIIVGFSMIIMVPLLLFSATLYGFARTQANQSQSQAQISQSTVGNKVYDISISESANSQVRIHLMMKDVLLTAFVILISTALAIGLWIYRSIATPLVKLKKATQNIKEGNLDFVLEVVG